MKKYSIFITPLLSLILLGSACSSIANNENSNELSTLCTEQPSAIASGRSVYPIAEKYEAIDHLGQIFTAYECGPDRVSKIFGINNGEFTIGSTIWLNEPPATELRDVLDTIGYVCEGGADVASCKKWRVSDPITIENLMLLEPFHENLKADDCVSCG